MNFIKILKNRIFKREQIDGSRFYIFVFACSCSSFAIYSILRNFTHFWCNFTRCAVILRVLVQFYTFFFQNSQISKILRFLKFLDFQNSFKQIFKILRFSKFLKFQNSQIFKILKVSKFLDFQNSNFRSRLYII